MKTHDNVDAPLQHGCSIVYFPPNGSGGILGKVLEVLVRFGVFEHGLQGTFKPRNLIQVFLSLGLSGLEKAKKV